MMPRGVSRTAVHLSCFYILKKQNFKKKLFFTEKKSAYLLCGLGADVGPEGAVVGGLHGAEVARHGGVAVLGRAAPPHGAHAPHLGEEKVVLLFCI